MVVHPFFAFFLKYIDIIVRMIADLSLVTRLELSFQNRWKRFRGSRIFGSWRLSSRSTSSYLPMLSSSSLTKKRWTIEQWTSTAVEHTPNEEVAGWGGTTVLIFHKKRWLAVQLRWTQQSVQRISKKVRVNSVASSKFFKLNINPSRDIWFNFNSPFLL